MAASNVFSPIALGICLPQYQAEVTDDFIFRVEQHEGICNLIPLTETGKRFVPELEGTFMYVINTDDPTTLYCSTPAGDVFGHTNGYIDGHTSLSKRKDVLYAGELVFRKGRLTRWNNASGHYKPLAEMRKTNIHPALNEVLKPWLFDAVDIELEVPLEGRTIYPRGESQRTLLAARGYTALGYTPAATPRIPEPLMDQASSLVPDESGHVILEAMAPGICSPIPSLNPESTTKIVNEGNVRYSADERLREQAQPMLEKTFSNPAISLPTIFEDEILSLRPIGHLPETASPAPVEMMAALAKTKLKPVMFTHGPLFIDQIKDGLPATCAKRVYQVMDEIRGGRLSKDMRHKCYSYNVDMGEIHGNRKWRLLIAKLLVKGETVHQINGIIREHGNDIVAWGDARQPERVLGNTLHQDPLHPYRSLYSKDAAEPDQEGVRLIDGQSYVPLIGHGRALFRFQRTPAGHWQLSGGNATDNFTNAMRVAPDGNGQFFLVMTDSQGRAEGIAPNRLIRLAQVVHKANQRRDGRREPLLDKSLPTPEKQTATAFNANDQPLPSEFNETVFVLQTRAPVRPHQPVAREPGTSLREELQALKAKPESKAALDAAQVQDVQWFEKQLQAMLIHGGPLPTYSLSDSALLTAPFVFELLDDAMWPKGRAYSIRDEANRWTRFTRKEGERQRCIVSAPAPGDLVIEVPHCLAGMAAPKAVSGEAQDLAPAPKSALSRYGVFNAGIYSRAKGIDWYPVPGLADGANAQSTLVAAIAACNLVAKGDFDVDLHASKHQRRGWRPRIKQGAVSAARSRWALQVEGAGQQLLGHMQENMRNHPDAPTLKQALGDLYKSDAQYLEANLLWKVLETGFDDPLNRLYSYRKTYAELIKHLADEPGLLVRLFTQDIVGQRSFHQALTRQLDVACTSSSVNQKKRWVDPEMEQFVFRHLQTLSMLQHAGYDQEVKASLAGAGSLGNLIDQLPDGSILHEPMARLCGQPDPSKGGRSIKEQLLKHAAEVEMTEAQAKQRCRNELPGDPRLNSVWQDNWDARIRNATGAERTLFKAQYDLEKLQISEVYDVEGTVSSGRIRDAQIAVDSAHKNFQARVESSRAQANLLLGLSISGPTPNARPTSISYTPPPVSVAPVLALSPPAQRTVRSVTQVQPDPISVQQGSLKRSQTLTDLTDSSTKVLLPKLKSFCLPHECAPGVDESNASDLKLPDKSPAQALEQLLLRSQGPSRLRSRASVNNLTEKPSYSSAESWARRASADNKPLSKGDSLPSMTDLRQSRNTFDPRVKPAQSLSRVISDTALAPKRPEAFGPQVLPVGGRHDGSYYNLPVVVSYGHGFHKEAALLGIHKNGNFVIPDDPEPNRAALGRDPNGSSAATRAPSQAQLTQVDTRGVGVGFELLKAGHMQKIYTGGPGTKPTTLTFLNRPEVGTLAFQSAYDPKSDRLKD